MQFLEKIMENVRNHTHINHNHTHVKLFGISTKLSYYIFFTENLLAIEMKKAEILMNKPVHEGLFILELSKILFYSFDMIMIMFHCIHKYR